MLHVSQQRACCACFRLGGLFTATPCCRLWLQNRCGYLLQAQALLSHAADPEFSTWNQVHDHVMRSSTPAQPTMTLGLTATRSAATIDASASFVLQQVHSSVIIRGSETVLKGLSDLLGAALKASPSAKPRPQGEDPLVNGGSPSSSAKQGTITCGPSMKLRLSLLVVASQVCTASSSPRPLCFCTVCSDHPESTVTGLVQRSLAVLVAWHRMPLCTWIVRSHPSLRSPSLQVAHPGC